MELAAIINRYQDRFNNHYSNSITNQQHHALQSIAACHTERYEVNCEAREGALGHGEMKLHCSDCNNQLSRFHCAWMHRCREAQGCARAAIRVVIAVVRGVRITTPRAGWSGNHKSCFP